MPALWMDVDVALSEVSINIAALIDDTDFKTREESVTYDQSGLDLLWNFVTTAGAFTQTAVTPTDTGGDYDFVNQNNAMYTIEIPASGGASINNDTEGFGWFSGFATGVLPWIGPVIGFRAAAINNLMIDTSTALTNLLAMYDGTGYTDDTAPASRSQVDNIGAASGGAISFAPSSDNTSGAIIDSVTKVWATVSGTLANVANDDGTSHDFTDSGDVIDHVYGFAVGGGRQAVRVNFKANVDGNNDTILLKAYDHVGSDWETIAVIEGSGGTVNRVGIPALFSKHTGTGGELGNVYIRFDTDSTTPSDLKVSLLQVEAVNIGQTVGYANGSIWINTAASNTNTESFVDGVADNPVSTIAAAKTISTAVGLGDFHIFNGSSITLAESTVNESYFGDNWTLALGGQTVTGGHFQGASVSGTHVGACEFTDCDIGNITTIADTEFEDCHINGTITLPVGDVFMSNCHHGGAFILDFGAAVGSTTVHLHKFAGAVELQNFGDNGTDILHIDGNGKLIINANSSGGTIHIRGNWEVEDNDGNATFNYDDQSSALDTAIPELGVAAPAATPTVRTALMLMYMALRNKLVVQTSGTDALEIYNDAGTKITKKLLTDDGSDYTEAEMN